MALIRKELYLLSKRGRLELCLYISLVVSLHRILQYSFVVTLS